MPTREKVDLVKKKLVHVELINGNRLTPMVHVDAKILEELDNPWKEALVVKLLGKNFGYNIMKAKLSSRWRLLGRFEIMDVGNGYFVVLFDDKEDRNKVMNEGPWRIFDHYLSVRLWTPNFIADRATIDKTLVWVQIPSLNIRYYVESLLMALASAIGKPIKIDLHTLQVECNTLLFIF